MHMDELKSQKVWLCWNYETRKGKRTKVPISASGTATGTNSEYAHTWVTYDEAIKVADKHGYNGVGFKIPQGYFFLDIDHRELNHEIGCGGIVLPHPFQRRYYTELCVFHRGYLPL